MFVYVPSVTYVLRLFIVVLQELQCLIKLFTLLSGEMQVSITSLSFVTLNLLKSMCIPSFVLIGSCVSELCGNLCPHRDIWPEAVYCCFTRTTLFSELFTYYHLRCCLLLLHLVSLPYTL